MNQPEVLAAFDHDQRVALEQPGLRKDALPDLVRFVRQGPGMSFVTHTRPGLDAARLDQLIAEQVAYFAALGQPFTWKVYTHDCADTLRERLLAHSFAGDEAEPVLALDLQTAPDSLLEPPAADVRRVTDPSQIDAIVGIEAQVWGGDFDWLARRMADHLRVPGYLSAYVAYVDGEPACAGWTYFTIGSRFAGLFGGSTLPQQRGRGLYTALLQVRTQEAIARGYHYLLIEPTEMSRPIVSRHGFELLTHAQDYQLS